MPSLALSGLLFGLSSRLSFCWLCRVVGWLAVCCSPSVCSVLLCLFASLVWSFILFSLLLLFYSYFIFFSLLYSLLSLLFAFLPLFLFSFFFSVPSMPPPVFPSSLHPSHHPSLPTSHSFTLSYPRISILPHISYLFFPFFP